MKYSFKKHINNEYFTGLLFYASFIPIIILIFIIISFIIINFIENNDINIDTVFRYFDVLIILPVISVISFITLLERIFYTKEFVNNCIEIDAKIEKYLCYYSNHSINATYEDGTETAILITFTYTYNYKQYRTRYSIQNNKHTSKYFDNYKEYGETVKILINKNKPWKMKIKEMYLY